MKLEQIEELAETFFEFPSEEKNYVTLVSALLFASHCCKIQEVRKGNEKRNCNNKNS
jgi:hypothetical protein